MRAAIPLVLVALLLAPAPFALERESPAGADPPRDSRPHLMPPEPGAQVWPSATRQGDPMLPPGPAQTTGTVRILVLLVQFTDVPATQTPAFVDGVFNDASPGAKSMHAYYSEVSIGTLTIQATVIATWFQSVHPMSDYGADGSSPPDDANGPIYRLVTETVRLADPMVDFSAFDADADGVVDHITIVHAGAGQEGGGSSDLIWSHRWAALDADPTVPGSQSLMADGVQIYGYTMVGEDSPVGVVAHEFGHDLGLPDLYDTDGSSDGAGIWDIMAGGSWNGAPAGTSPADMSAWSRIRLGWIAPTEVTTALIDTSVAQVETSGKAFRLSIPGASSSEYFLIENRESVGFDAALPGSGLLIWHVDDSLSSNDVDTHRRLDLVEADEGLTGDHPTDAGDPWHDTKTGWGPDTNPDSRAYSGSDTGWRVRDISASGATMTATIAREVTRDLAVSAIRLPFLEAVGSTIGVSVDVRNDGVQASDVTLDVAAYRDAVVTASRAAQESFSRTGVAAQTTVTFFLNFTANAAGRYLVLAELVDANDEIPTNDARAAHVLVTTLIRFRDAVEAGPDSWTLNGNSTDAHRWEIVNDTDPDGAAHSRTHAWRFGYVSTLIPSLFPPEWHTLTSPAMSVTPGPTFLIFYGRYDLRGRSVPVLPIGSNDTDDAYVEVSYGGGPWIPLAHYTGRDLTWRGTSFNLTANITGPTTLQVRFNVSANVMANAGGWWVDDVAVASSGLGRAALLLGASSPYDGTAGETVRIGLKVANVGDLETDFRLDAVLPVGWRATVVGEPAGPLQGHVVRLAPDNDAAVRVDVALPLTAPSGALVSFPITATAVGDPNATASLDVQVRISGISTELLLVIVLVAAAILIAIVAVVGLRRRRRPAT
ncbi:MAG TPA: M6 family metalloprotease domain-containing protein [Thermoplasmata archaeon]|nr:M6 family metalloprotease domain-containing protein [Thermoplasmata archaeon]